jgi:predicted helicase
MPNQLNENENNKNRKYPDIDKRIKQTYLSESTAQKTKLYDPYVRFFRWASDRVDENGIIAFISNSSFINSRTFDGFRKVVTNEFNEIWIVNLKGDARYSGERRRQEGGNIFNDQIRVGIAVYFCVKKKSMKGCRIYYEEVRDYAKADEKVEFLTSKRLAEREFIEIRPDTQSNWINLTENDFSSFIPLATKATKSAKKPSQERAIFKLFSLGVVTARDEWVYGEDPNHLETKIRALVDAYNADLHKLRPLRDSDKLPDLLDSSIKWSRAVKNDLRNGVTYKTEPSHIIKAMYRPFFKTYLYFDENLNEMRYQLPAIFGNKAKHRIPTIVFTDASSQKPFMTLACDSVFDYHLAGAAAAAVAVPLVRHDSSGQPIDNITDWGLKQFRKKLSLKAHQIQTPHYQGRYLSLRLRRTSRPDLSGPIRTKPQPRTPSHSILR